MKRTNAKAPSDSPALIFYKKNINFANVVRLGVINKLFYLDEAVNNKDFAVKEVRELLEKKLRKYVLEEDFEAISNLVGEEVTSKNISKYK